MLLSELLEFVQQLVEGVPADDPLAVRLGNAGLPHSEPASPMMTSGCAARNAWSRSTWPGSSRASRSARQLIPASPPVMADALQRECR